MSASLHVTGHQTLVHAGGESGAPQQSNSDLSQVPSIPTQGTLSLSGTQVSSVLEWYLLTVTTVDEPLRSQFEHIISGCDSEVTSTTCKTLRNMLHSHGDAFHTAGAPLSATYIAEHHSPF